LNTEKNRVQVVLLPVIWAKSHVIANKQYIATFVAMHIFLFVKGDKIKDQQSVTKHAHNDNG
jgi:hypothetical protein